MMDANDGFARAYRAALAAGGGSCPIESGTFGALFDHDIEVIPEPPAVKARYVKTLEQRARYAERRRLKHQAAREASPWYALGPNGRWKRIREPSATSNQKSA